MISVTVFKFDTFLVNYITLLFCQNKNISLSLSFHCHNQNNKSHNNSKERNIRGSKNNAKVSGIGNKFNDGQKKLKSSNDNSRIPRGGISNKSSRINCDKATNQNPVIHVSSNGGVNSNCTKSVSVLK